MFFSSFLDWCLIQSMKGYCVNLAFKKDRNYEFYIQWVNMMMCTQAFWLLLMSMSVAPQWSWVTSCNQAGNVYTAAVLIAKVLLSITPCTVICKLNNLINTWDSDCTIHIWLRHPEENKDYLLPPTVWLCARACLYVRVCVKSWRPSQLLGILSPRTDGLP